MTVAIFSPLGSSSTAGCRAGDGIAHPVDGRRDPFSSTPRSGTYSPNGTRRTLSYRLTISPSGLITTWALVKRRRPSTSTSSVSPTEIGTPSRAASAAICWAISDDSNVTTSIVFSGHSTRSRSGSGSIVAVASRCRSVTRIDGTSSAEVPCSPPPCTAATRNVSPVACPSGTTNDSPITTVTAASADHCSRTEDRRWRHRPFARSASSSRRR